MNKKELEAVYLSLLRFYEFHENIPVGVFAKKAGVAPSSAKGLLDSLRDISEEKKQEEPPQVIKPPEPPTLSAPTNKVPISEEGTYVVLFLKFLALPFSILALLLSTYFSVGFLSKQFPMLLAIGLSVTLIGFGMFCFETMVLFGKRKNYWQAFLFGAMWFFITIYSVGTSVSSLYESYLMRMYNNQVSKEDTNANKMIYQNYLDEEKEKNVLMEDKRKRLEAQQGILATFSTYELQKENRKIYDNAYWLATQIEKEVTKISERISELRKLKQELLTKDAGIATITQERPDVYTWLAKIFKTSGDFMQFILQVIPACVLDVISPTALFIFLFLRRKENVEVV